MARFERVHAAQPGYAGNVVVDLGEGDRFVITLWASGQHAAAARTALGPVVRDLLGPLERAPSQLLGVGRVIRTDLVLAAWHEEQQTGQGGDVTADASPHSTSEPEAE